MVKNGYWMFIFRKGRVLVPTMAKTEAGFYVGVEPVHVLDEWDSEGIESAIVAAVERGNPRIPTPNRNEYGPDIVLKHAGVRSRDVFNRLARTWNLSLKDGMFQISPSRPGRYGGAEEDLDRQETISHTVPLHEVARRLIQRALNERIEPEGPKH
jgi:hypothetical protein